MSARQPLRRKASQPRCEGCGCWLTPIRGGTDTTCANERCPQSWRSARASFETSMLGAAVHQMLEARDAA